MLSVHVNIIHSICTRCLYDYNMSTCTTGSPYSVSCLLEIDFLLVVHAEGVPRTSITKERGREREMVA